MVAEGVDVRGLEGLRPAAIGLSNKIRRPQGVSSTDDLSRIDDCGYHVPTLTFYSEGFAKGGVRRPPKKG